MRVVDNVGFDVKKQDIPGGGSGSGNSQPLATPDWNQNDETAADYIKNRPFYTTDPVETELVNRSFAFAESPNLGFYMSPNMGIELIAGETYKVTLDGVEYEETVCQAFQEGAFYIGAPEFLNGATPPSDMPFICTYNSKNGVSTFGTTTGFIHKIIIKSIKSQIIPIPEQYIPEMSSVTLLSSTADSTKKFKITVDDSGTLKATEVTG